MPYDEALADRVRSLLIDQQVSKKRMFGGIAFLVAGHMAVAASSQGGLMVRVEPVAGERLLTEPGAEPVVMGSRPAMKGWVLVRGVTLTDPVALEAWVQRGLRYVQSLPPKS
ncbi:MAG: TfoX/Sxy family protein [Actinobacteria bacterium]|nr:TfoX/Sxy family protein [Actinomycetota bacterium]